MAQYVTSEALGDYGPNCLQIINRLLLCSFERFGIIHHLSHGHSYLMKKILDEVRLRVQLMVILDSFHFQIITPIFLLMVLYSSLE